MKRVLIIHGWQSNSEEHWYQEEKNILESKGYEVSVPDMPNSNFPKQQEWVKVIEDFKPTENDVLIGHSLGVPTILRYLEDATGRVDKVFLFAGFASPLKLDVEDGEYPDSFVTKSFDWDAIKIKANNIYVINQRNDEWVPKEKGIEIADKLKEEIILVDGTNHFDTMDLDLINDRI